MAETPVEERSDRITPSGWLRNGIAWIVIAAVSAFIILEGIGLQLEPDGQPEELIFATNPQLEMMGRMAEGMSHSSVAGSAGVAQMAGTSSADIERMAASAGAGATPHAAIILARMHDLRGAKAAMERLQQQIESGKVMASPDAMRVVADVTQALGVLEQAQAARAQALDQLDPEPDAMPQDSDPSGPPDKQVLPLTGEQEARLKEWLGGSGEMLVAMASNDQAALDARAEAGLRVLFGLGAAVCLAVPAGIAGLVLLVVFMALAFQGRNVGAGPTAGARAPIYAEMFAVWMVAFLLLAKLPRAFLGEHAPGEAPPISTEWQLFLGILGMALALLVSLAYVRVRGVSLRQMTQDMAMDRPRLSDPLWGFVGYLMGVALLALGLVVTLILMAATSGEKGAMPSHPIQEWLQSGSTTTVLLTFIVASVMAPITEEIVFRGAMYRNLCDTFSLLGPFVAAALSTIVSSVIFAAIHPQGLVFIPVLGSLAVAFCILRQWRGSIYPGIWAHAINNTLILTLNIVLLNG
jgi:membrane protease YdiL (CAAX protease family)